MQSEKFLQPWLDEINLLPGQDWELEITRAVRAAHCVVVCLSKRAMDATGYVHKEIGLALDVAERKPEGAIFVIPVKLENCPVPDLLVKYQWVNLYEPEGYYYLLRGLRALANGPRL